MIVLLSKKRGLRARAFRFEPNSSFISPIWFAGTTRTTYGCRFPAVRVAALFVALAHPARIERATGSQHSRAVTQRGHTGAFAPFSFF